jgi:hypothetical protein
MCPPMFSLPPSLSPSLPPPFSEASWYRLLVGDADDGASPPSFRYPLYVKALIMRHKGKIQDSLRLFQAATILNPTNVNNLKQASKRPGDPRHASQRLPTLPFYSDESLLVFPIPCAAFGLHAHLGWVWVAGWQVTLPAGEAQGGLGGV